MVSTFEVSNLDTFIEINDEQPLNMPLIDVTFEVSKFDTFIEVNNEQPLNI